MAGLSDIYHQAITTHTMRTVVGRQPGRMRGSRSESEQNSEYINFWDTFCVCIYLPVLSEHRRWVVRWMDGWVDVWNVI